MVKHFQSSQNSKFAMSLKYLRYEVWVEVAFLHADKHQSGLQVDVKTLATKVSYKMILSLLMSMMKHSQSFRSDKFANLCNMSKKNLGMGYIFCKQMIIKVSKSFPPEKWKLINSPLLGQFPSWNLKKIQTPPPPPEKSFFPWIMFISLCWFILYNLMYNINPAKIRKTANWPAENFSKILVKSWFAIPSSSYAMCSS